MKLHHVVEGAGPTLVLIGSLGSSLEMWEPQLAALNDFRVMRIDLPGHGGSPVPDAAFDIADIGRAVLALVDRRASVCGLSLGGLAAMWLAAHTDVDRVVLACTKPRFDPPEQWVERAALVRRDGLEPIVDAVLARWFTPEADPAIVERERAMFLATPPEGYARCCDVLRDADLTPELARIEAAVLVIVGERDPSVTRDEAAALPGRLVTIAGAAHLASAERPHDFNAALREHLA
jgi:3-oxoadipate enol-lactonase